MVEEERRMELQHDEMDRWIKGLVKEVETDGTGDVGG